VSDEQERQQLVERFAPAGGWSNQVVINSMAWVPKHVLTQVALAKLRKQLTARIEEFSFGKGRKREVREEISFLENDYWFGMPRGFYARTSKRKLPEIHEVVDTARVFNAAIGPRDEMQEKGVATMLSHLEAHEAAQGMLCAGTGVGKTVLSLIIAGHLARTTLVVVHMEALYYQWQERILETVGGGLPGVLPDARLGLFRGNTEQWGDGYDIVVAMAQTLINRPVDHPIFSWPGTMIVDEAHRFGSSQWSKIAPRFNASKRIGCTATPRRKDGAEQLFFDHLGDIAWTGSKPMLSPQVRKVKTSFSFKKDYPKWIEDDILCKDDRRNALIGKELSMAYRAGRNVLVACKRLQHVLFLKKLIERSDPDATIGMCVGKWFVDEDDAVSYYLDKRKYASQFFNKYGDFCPERIDDGVHKIKYTKKNGERVIDKIVPRRKKVSMEEFDEAKGRDILLATEKKVAEGFDVPKLDTLFVVTPTWDIEQLAGRILRLADDKKTPVVTHFIDEHVPKYKNAWRKCEKQYIDIGGSF
jgi:superfamily II DNA or RNA helicase